MLKVFLSLSLILFVSCGPVTDGRDKNVDDNKDVPVETDEKINKKNKVMRLPEGDEMDIMANDNEDVGSFTQINLDDCISEEVYSPDEVKDYKEESDYLCGFYAFQANKVYDSNNING